MKQFKVKTGFGEGDFTIIDETELQTALRAQITGKIALLKDASISGNSILNVKPYYNQMMGYNRNYELVDEDYREVGAKAQREHQLFFEEAKLAIEGKTRFEAPQQLQGEVKKLAASMRV